jgi:hypothetical protein
MLKRIVLAAAAAVGTMAISSAALAHDDWKHGWKHGHYKHHYYAPGPVYVVPAPRVVYAPPPAVFYPAPVYAAPVYAAPVYPAPVYHPAPAYPAPPGVSIRFSFPL